MSWSERLYRVPPVIAGGTPVAAWLGLLLAWGALGFGAAASSSAAGLLLSAGSGACGTHSATVCQVAGWGGLLLGVTALAGATGISLFAARGFGPPVTWWVLSAGLGAIAVAPFTSAEALLLTPGWLLLSGLAMLGALLLAIGAVRRGRAALLGWIRLDGLDAREVPHRAAEQVVALAAAAAALAGGAFGAHVIRLLAEA